MLKEKIIIIFIMVSYLFFYKINIIEAAEILKIAVHDGDTVTVTAKNRKKIKIRLLGIDAPELEQENGNASKRHLNRLLKNNKITYKTEYKDSFGRSVATIFAGKQDINLQMVKDGYAWHYRQFSKSKKLEAAQENAQKNRLGLWSSKNPMPPWEFRKEQKKIPNTRSEPFYKIPIDFFYVCVHPKTLDTVFRMNGCPKGYFTAVGNK